MNKKDLPFEIILEDENYIFINKNSGILTIPDRYNYNLPNLVSILSYYRQNIFVVHRLDKDTSGVMMFAKNEKSHKLANTSFEDQLVERKYHVLVRGQFPMDEIEIDIPLLMNMADKGRVIPSARGKHSLTKVKILEKFRYATLLECELVTGRQHQIRVHLSTIGYPLLVDNLYSDNREFYLSMIKRNYNSNEDIEEKPILKRLSMHSFSLKYKDELSGKEIFATANYPKDFETALKLLRKYSKFN